MLVIDKYSPVLIFDVEGPGIYTFESKSGLGKTRLAEAMKVCQCYGENIASYSYDDFLLGIPISKVLDPKYKVIMLDRYSMYNGEGKDLIKKLSDKSVILIDCKDGLAVVCDDGWCTIEMDAYKIMVVS